MQKVIQYVTSKVKLILICNSLEVFSFPAIQKLLNDII